MKVKRRAVIINGRRKIIKGKIEQKPHYYYDNIIVTVAPQAMRGYNTVTVIVLQNVISQPLAPLERHMC